MGLPGTGVGAQRVQAPMGQNLCLKWQLTLLVGKWIIQLQRGTKKTTEVQNNEKEMENYHEHTKWLQEGTELPQRNTKCLQRDTNIHIDTINDYRDTELLQINTNWLQR